MGPQEGGAVTGRLACPFSEGNKDHNVRAYLATATSFPS